jgi:hypothetical protein
MNFNISISCSLTGTSHVTNMITDGMCELCLSATNRAISSAAAGRYLSVSLLLFFTEENIWTQETGTKRRSDKAA